ncbi:hypothetical protein FGG78_20165 [Thioclava sp. BHET1]|nr:hypothetical protein FGG78_20165 [Thioclava sp. BHET1]
MNVIACIDMNAKACNRLRMKHSLLDEIEDFRAATGLSEHRVGFLLAKNGRLIERLRLGRPIEVPTMQRVQAALLIERQKRNLKSAGQA